MKSDGFIVRSLEQKKEEKKGEKNPVNSERNKGVSLNEFNKPSDYEERDYK